MLIADRAWDQDGQLFFNIFNLDGFLGDRILTNWLWKPYLDVRARRYRFRLLNGSVSRYFRLALVTEDDERVPFYMIANDGNIMEHAIYFENGETPTMAIAERYDIIVDFANYAPGTKLYMMNLLEHNTGKRPEENIPLEEVLSGDYRARERDGQWRDGDPAVGKFLEFRVQPYDGVDRSLNPADYVPGGKKMIPLPGFTAEELANARHRRFEFGRSSGTDTKPWTIKTDGGGGFGMDPRRLSAAPSAGDVEIWHLENGGGGWSHPIHVHFEEGQILKRGGLPPPVWERWARKDVYRIGRMDDSLDSVEVALRFREFIGTYMEHCHNTQHEDHSMLLRWDIENPGQLIVMPTPMPTWDGVTFVDSVSLPTFRTGESGGDSSGSGGGSGSGDDTPDTGDDTSGTGDDTSGTGDDTSGTGDDTTGAGDDTTGAGDDTTTGSGDDGPEIDVLTVTRAQFRTRRDEWRIEGTSQVTNGNVVSIYAGDGTSGALIGTVAVPSDGEWSFRRRNSTPASTITVVSSAGGLLTNVSVRQRR